MRGGRDAARRGELVLGRRSRGLYFGRTCNVHGPWRCEGARIHGGHLTSRPVRGCGGVVWWERFSFQCQNLCGTRPQFQMSCARPHPPQPLKVPVPRRPQISPWALSLNPAPLFWPHMPASWRASLSAGRWPGILKLKYFLSAVMLTVARELASSTYLNQEKHLPHATPHTVTDRT